VVLYVGNLPPSSDATVLHQLVAPYARIISAKVVTNKGTSICKGYGFVTVADQHQVRSTVW
jgi:RNA recognition motif-containing protein